MTQRAVHFDVGMDSYSPVSLAYYDRAPFKFTGKIDRLKINYLPSCRLTKKRRGHE